MTGVLPLPGLHLQSERLLFDPVTAADIAVLVRHVSDNAVRRYLWGNDAVDFESVNAVVRISDDDFARRRHGLWALRARDNAALVGMCGLRGSQQLPWPQLLYNVRPRFRERGLATEAASRVLQYAFDSLHLERVVAFDDGANRDSSRVLRRLGMRPSSERGEECFSSVTAGRYRALWGTSQSQSIPSTKSASRIARAGSLNSARRPPDSASATRE